MATKAFRSLESSLDSLCIKSRLFTPKNWQYCCVLSGILSFLLAFFVLVAADMLPPMAATWDADRVHKHYLSNVTGIRASVPLLLISAGLFIPFSALISKQMGRITNVDPILCQLQLAACAASIFSFMIPATILGLIVFRDYGPELTLMINDQFWLNFFLPWPCFWIQSWTTAWAIFADNSPNPVFPKIMGLVNFVVPLTFTSLSGVHTAHRGPYAWNGALTFWLPAVAFGAQVGTDAMCLLTNIRAKSDHHGSPEESLTSRSQSNE